MKEKIYTIPVNEAYDEASGCPFCYLEDRLEKETVDYALGAAMMEPDYRIKSNSMGYCHDHFEKLFQQPNKLSLALTLDTHLEEIRTLIAAHEKAVQDLSGKKKGLFKKNTSSIGSSLSEGLEKVNTSCVICEKIQTTMDRYIDVFFYLWQKEEDFRKKFENSTGFCLHHLEVVYKSAEQYLNQEQYIDFMTTLLEIEKKHLDELQEDIHRFTLKFDYRNKDMEWGNAKDAPIRVIQKLVGNIEQSEE